MEVDVSKELFLMKNEKYKKFQSSLIPSAGPDSIIGVRVPDLRVLAGRLKKEGLSHAFLSTLPHAYHEENYIHALLLSDMRDFDECVSEVDRFLPFVDNWAVCDGLRPACFAENKEALLRKIHVWIRSGHTYTLRFGIEMLMLHFLEGDCFSEEHLDICAGVRSDEYYVNMMLAWFFATALAFQYESTVRYIEEKRLSLFVHNKCIQKATESSRVSKSHKAYLKSLRIKR